MSSSSSSSSSKPSLAIAETLAMSSLSNTVLPDVLIEDILVRLPVKSIGRFRCVSKPWQTLLKSHKFVKSHIKLHILKPAGYLFPRYPSDRGSPYILTLGAAENNGNASNDGVARELPSELKRCELKGSCNGLLLFEKQEGSFILMNPITLETVHILDDRDLDPDMSVSSCFCGFGYDSTNDDYKIVVLTQLVEDDDDGYGDLSSIVDVYSLRMKRWKRIANDSPFYLYTGEERYPVGAFLNGCIHWFNEREDVLCFDLAREEFVVGLFPDHVEKEFAINGVEWFGCYDIKVFNGCLAMVSFLPNRTWNIWVMREYGVRDSWMKFASISPENENDCIEDTLCELNEDEIVLEKGNVDSDAEKLVAYNWRNETSRDLVIAGLPPDGYFDKVAPFKGSLLSPNL